MADRDPEQPHGKSMPSLMWGLMAILVIALFVLALGILRP